MSNSEVKDQDSNVAYDSNNSTPFYFYEKLSGNNDNEFKRPKLMPPLSWENLVPPSEVFEKEINKFGSTLSTERKGEKTDENSEQILVDFDYLNALSEMPNIEPIKRLTKNYPNASSGSNSEYLFHWMDFREEHNQIPLMHPVMDADLLRDLNIPLIFCNNQESSSKLLKLMMEKRKELLDKSKSREELLHDTSNNEHVLEKEAVLETAAKIETPSTIQQSLPPQQVQQPFLTTISNISRVDDQSENSESEEETKMYIMEDDNYEIGGFNTIQQPFSHGIEPKEINNQSFEPVKTPQILGHVSERKEESTKTVSSPSSVQSISLSATSTMAPSTSSGNAPQVTEPKKKRKRSKKKKADESQLKKASSKPTPNPLAHLGKFSCLTHEDVAFYLKGLKQFKAFQKQTALSNALPPPSPLFFKLKKMVEEEQAIYRKALFDDAWNNRLVRYFHTDPYIMEQVEKMKQKKKLDRLVPPTSVASNFQDMKHVLPRHFELVKSMNLFNLQATKMLVSTPAGASSLQNFADPILKFSKTIYHTSDKYFTYHRNTLIYQQESAEQIDDTADETSSTVKPVKIPKLPISTNIYKVDDPSLNPISAMDNSSAVSTDHSAINVVYDPLKHLQKSTSSMNVYLHRNLPQVSDDCIINDIILPRFPEIDFVCASSAMSALVNTLGPNFSEEWCIPVIAKPYSSSTTSGDTTMSQNKFTIFLEKPLLKKVWTQRDVNQMYYKYAIKTVSLREPLIHVPSKTAISTLNIDEQQSCENFSQLELMHRDGEPISYNLFTLGNWKILFRTKIDGAYNDVKTDRATVVKLITKLEYQTEKGLELSTQSELAKWWTNVFLRPASAIIVNRVDVAQNRVCRTEFKRVKDVLPEVEDEEEENERYWSNVLTSNLSSHGVAGGGANCGFQPQLSIQTVYGVLTELMNLISTFNAHNLLDYRFLIQKMANEPYIHLLVEHRKSSSVDSLIPRSQKFYYDLHMDYEKHGGVNDLNKMDYIPLTWKSKKQIPYTFPIRPSQTSTKEKHKRKNKGGGKSDQSTKKAKQ